MKQNTPPPAGLYRFFPVSNYGAVLFTPESVDAFAYCNGKKRKTASFAMLAELIDAGRHVQIRLHTWKAGQPAVYVDMVLPTGS